MVAFISARPSGERAARPPCCATFDAPLNSVVMMRVQSLITGVPSAKQSVFGTTDHPRRTPVNPAGFEYELISIAQSLAPGISKMVLGSPGVRINCAYAASKIIMHPCDFAKSTSVCSSSFVDVYPVGLFGGQK